MPCGCRRATCPSEPLDELLPSGALADAPPPLPELTEPDVVRHFMNLSTLNMSVDTHFYPLGSCTMKYNPKRNERLAACRACSTLHPYQPEATLQGMLELLYELQEMLAEIAGLPRRLAAAGGRGARRADGPAGGRRLLPRSRRSEAHQGAGSRQRPRHQPGQRHAWPASSTVTVKSTPAGYVDLDDLAAKLDDPTAVFMITNPNTLGMFDRQIAEIAELVHAAGGLVYLDGANMNAILGIARPGDFGADMMHFNPHKTFSGPHGGGGPAPGRSPSAASWRRTCPRPWSCATATRYRLDYDRPKSIGRVRAFFGNVGVLVRAYCYIRTHGPDGLRRVAENAVLNANYLLSRGEAHPARAAGRSLHARVRRLGRAS